MQAQLEDAAQAVRQATLKRPTAERVAQAWGRIGEVWPVLSEEEREGVLGGVVQGVTVTGKEEVTLELLPMPLPLDPSAISHFLGFNLERELGAGRLVVVNYPPIQFPDFEVTRLTRNNSTTVLSS